MKTVVAAIAALALGIPAFADGPCIPQGVTDLGYQHVVQREGTRTFNHRFFRVQFPDDASCLAFDGGVKRRAYVFLEGEQFKYREGRYAPVYGLTPKNTHFVECRGTRQQCRVVADKRVLLYRIVMEDGSGTYDFVPDAGGPSLPVGWTGRMDGSEIIAFRILEVPGFDAGARLSVHVEYGETFARIDGGDRIGCSVREVAAEADGFRYVYAAPSLASACEWTAAANR